MFWYREVVVPGSDLNMHLIQNFSKQLQYMVVPPAPFLIISSCLISYLSYVNLPCPSNPPTPDSDTGVILHITNSQLIPALSDHSQTSRVSRLQFSSCFLMLQSQFPHTLFVIYATFSVVTSVGLHLFSICYDRFISHFKKILQHLSYLTFSALSYLFSLVH